MLFLYLRIFSNPSFRRYVKWLIAISTMALVSWLAAVIFQCSPIESNWDWPFVEGKCINNTALLYFTASANIFLDVVTMVIPIFEIRTLNLSLGKRFLVSGLFALGSL